MRRRAFIGTLYGGVAALLLIRCGAPTASDHLRNFVDDEEYRVLSSVIATIIPLEPAFAGLHESLVAFVLTMVQDCHSTSEHTRFLNGLRRVSKQGFTHLATAEREDLLRTLETGDLSDDDDISFFYRTTKRRTVQGFLTSKYVMTDLGQYELVPGRYDGYYPVKS